MIGEQRSDEVAQRDVGAAHNQLAVEIEDHDPLFFSLMNLELVVKKHIFLSAALKSV